MTPESSKPKAGKDDASRSRDAKRATIPGNKPRRGNKSKTRGSKTLRVVHLPDQGAEPKAPRKRDSQTSAARFEVSVGPEIEGLQRVIIAANGQKARRRIHVDNENERQGIIAIACTKCNLPKVLQSDIDAEIQRKASEARPAVKETKGKARPSHTGDPLDMVKDVRFFHTAEQEAFATIPCDGHHETWPLKSLGFQDWLGHRYFRQNGRALPSRAMKAAINEMAARARFDGPKLTVHVRLALHRGNIYLDLGDSDWRAVKITPQGWSVVTDCPVKFRRPSGLRPLPAPQPGGKLLQLKRFLNIQDKDDWTLTVGELLGMFDPRGPYPVVVLYGEQGTAKSTRVRLLRSLIDPQLAAVRSAPREERDLFISANNSWLLAYDNLSSIPAWLSDAFCCLSTGGGFAKRKLFSDADETIIDVRRPVIMNGIPDLATRDDLLDRAIVHELRPIPDDKRQAEGALTADFEAARPKILGAVLTAVSAALANLPTIKFDKLPRMADFVLWVSAAEPALGWKTGRFKRAYEKNRRQAQLAILEASPLATPLCRFMEALVKEGVFEWKGQATKLLQELGRFRGEDDGKSGDETWPKGASALSNKLRRLAPAIRRIGISVGRDRTPDHSRRLIIITAEHDFRAPKDQSDPGPCEVGSHV